MSGNFESQIIDQFRNQGIKRQKDIGLFVEAYRRKVFLKADNKFLGLGFSTEYGSTYFVPTFSNLDSKRNLQWFTLTTDGMKILDSVIQSTKELVKSANINDINQQLFN